MNSAERLVGGSANLAVPASNEEAELVARAKIDRSAFEPLYIRYADPVYRYCYRRLSDPESAADATSQIFVKAIGGIGTCRGENFRSWLFAIAHNVLMDVYRTRRPMSPLDLIVEQPAEGPSPEDLALHADDRDRLRNVLDQLTPDQRQVLELRLAGLTTIEIAEALGRSRGAIDTAQCRAIQRLRSLLAEPFTSRRDADHAAG